MFSPLHTQLIELSRDFRIADLLDIIIIAILTYAVLTWFKRTTSRFVLIGIVILGLIYSVARFFNMYLTEYVFQGFFAILLIALVIIFQEDLKRFFERLATWRFLRKKEGPAVLEQQIEILTHAVANLARKRYGALIVLKGEEYIERHIEGGIELDGKLSESLLESLFDPHSIGHDGAIIIEVGRIIKFGCHLPLSVNTKKLRNVGLRHTAALGLAERSDALCIVVSEERGSIALAREETLRRLTGPEELKPALEEFFRKEAPVQSSEIWRRWLRENSLEKALALILACGLWLTFAYQTESVRRDYMVPIEYRNLQTEWVIEEPKEQEVSVSLTGSAQAFNVLNPQTLKIVLDMSELVEGSQTVAINRDIVRHPSNLSVIAINPGRIQLIAHKMTPVDIPVKIETTGQTPDGYYVSTLESIPKTVKVLALPKNHRRIRIKTEPLNLDTIIATTTVTSKLVFPTNVQFVNGKPPVVQVRIEIEQSSENTQ